MLTKIPSSHEHVVDVIPNQKPPNRNKKKKISRNEILQLQLTIQCT